MEMESLLKNYFHAVKKNSGKEKKIAKSILVVTSIKVTDICSYK